MAKRVRDAADIQPEIDEVTKEINGVEAQVRKAKAAVEEDPQKAARATLRGIASSRSTGPTLDAHWSSILTRLRAVRELPVGSGVLTFESGLPLDPTYSSVYIRACYGPLFEELITSNYKNLIITGTGGTGKTHFLYYLLGMLMSLPEPPPYILWEHMTLNDEMLCYDRALGQVLSGTRRDFKDQRNHPKAWYISDGIAPNMSAQARIILITSLRREIYREMEKSGARILYMPLWSLNELLDCRAKVYGSSVPEDLATRLYEHFGGVARYVLGVPSVAKPTAGLDSLDSLLLPLTKALEASSPAQVQAGLGGLEVGPEASDHLLHIVTKDNFKLSHLYFASPFVGDKMVARALMKDGLEGLATMMVRTRGAMRAYLYEQVMHQLMPQGGTFRVVPISSSDEALSRSGPETDLELHSCTSRIFKEEEEIWARGEFEENVYFQLAKANFPTVDSVLRVDKTLHMFQITVDSSKTVSASALTSTFTRLGAEKLENVDLRLYYVVPPDILDDFKLRADASWPPAGKQQPLAARTRLFLLKGDAEARLLQQEQAGVINRQRLAATVAAARPAAMMVAPVVKRAAAPSSGRIRRVWGGPS